MFTSMLVASLIAPAPDFNEAAKKELKTLEGNWALIAIVINGVERDLPENEQAAVTLKGRKFSFGKFGDGEVTAIDGSIKPNLLDFKMLREPKSGDTNEAIYKLEKDTLIIVVYVGEDKKRPASFEAPTDAHTIRFTLKRAK